LRHLRDDGVLILGSGLSYHNLRQFGLGASTGSKTFDDWLQETLVETIPSEREARLLAWSAAPQRAKHTSREDT